MASYINTNLSSMQAQRSLSTSQAQLSTSIQRLSSGMRVNGAKDDAAGLAIATGMDKTVRGQTVAMRNANDAISFSQTTEGALGKVSDTLQRMRELAVQSANGTNSADQRGAMNTEFNALQKEITRVTDNTEFNGLKVLGKDSTQTFQIGAGTTDDNQIAINGTDLTKGTSTTRMASFTTAENEANNATYADALMTAAAATGGTFGTDQAVTKAGNDYTVGTAANTTITAKKDATTGAVSYTQTVDNGTDPAVTTDVTAKDFRKALTDAAGAMTAPTDAAEAATLDKAKTAFESQPAAAVDISTSAGAKDAMNKIDDALKEVNNAQTNQGAAQNRMSSVVSTLQVSNENQTAARSRIMDTDFASETANMARSQILQQASTAMLAQANQLPNGVMKLLG